MKLIDLVYPDCHLCRELRISICIGALVVIGTYMVQLLIINHEMRQKDYND